MEDGDGSLSQEYDVKCDGINQHMFKFLPHQRTKTNSNKNFIAMYHPDYANIRINI